MLIPFYCVLYHVLYCIGTGEINSPEAHGKMYYKITTGSILTVICRIYEPKYVRSSLFCDVMFCLFCVVLCIVCVYMCTELLPPGGYPVALNKYIISYHISYHIISYIISYHIISYHISSYIISYHISYHIISYHISYHISYQSISNNDTTVCTSVLLYTFCPFEALSPSKQNSYLTENYVIYPE